MATTYLQLVNDVLTRLRETTVANVSDSDYSALVGKLVNDAKRKRIKEGSGEKMRKPGTKGAPTAKAFKEAAKTAKKK